WPLSVKEPARPPSVSSRSNRVTSCPRLTSSYAAERPVIPPPMTPTLFLFGTAKAALGPAPQQVVPEGVFPRRHPVQTEQPQLVVDDGFGGSPGGGQRKAVGGDWD